MLLKRIRLLRISALFLFLIPFFGIIGSLFTHNLLISFNFQKLTILPIAGKTAGEITYQLCDSSNNYCDWNEYKLANKLDECHSHKIEITKIDIKGPVSIINDSFNLNEKEKPFFYKFVSLKNKDPLCILNSNFYKLYNIFPNFFEKISEMKSNPDFSLGTSEIVNPLIYGETSISNIVKRYPLKYIFKSTMLVSCILMVIYWFYYTNIFNSILNQKKIYLFLLFGIFSSIMLLLHTLFLGVDVTSNLLSKLRKIYIVFFLLFEILAQIFLIKQILLKKELLKIYLNEKIIKLKLYFVIVISTLTLFVISLFTIFKLDSRFDYIVEWNYFLFLLIFYLLSFFLWKKKLTFNPSTS